MKNVVIEKLNKIPTSKQKIEIVERKGIGHPDTICDSIVNQISVELSKFYMKKFGQIMHHNIDKALLSAGEVENRFGGGIIKKPMRLIVGDRATFFVGDERVPVEDVVISTAKKWFKDNLRFVDPEKHVEHQIELKQGSTALTDIFKREKEVLGANDTSAVVGYAPPTSLEKMVLKVEELLNSKKFKKRFPETGEDIKVMGLRKNNELELTIAMAFIDRFIDSEETYFRRKSEVLEELNNYLTNTEFEKTKVYLNNLDKRGRGIAGLYLTVLGTCADGADCGQVGRGNRVDGLISLSRPSGSEAAAGKNPVSHIGKIYSVLSFEIAREICKRLPEINEAIVWLLSRIGEPINQPSAVNIQLILDGELTKATLNEIENVVEFKFEGIRKLCQDLALGKIKVC
ncbi:MAG: methionine adenosyltransferase [Candidatus Aenigmarchaeota archaeon]|nr:methionine adenosyltransferase [Candidatus Aenigmarchaeota archaeon]